MKIRVRIFFAICAVVFVSSLFFTIAGYKAQEKALLDGADQKLYTAALMLKAMLPDDYHDNLARNSFTQEDYDAIIVARNNKLCKELGLQYLWSNMVVDGKIVFTTSTSPSKDISKKGQAKFFEAHSDPESFREAFRTMKPTYSYFYNEWGRGRMVLIPFLNKKGQAYCFGASMGTKELATILHGTLMEYVLFFLIAIIFGFIASIMISGSFRQNLERGREEFIATLQKNKSDLEKAKEELAAKTVELTTANKELQVANEEIEEATKELKKVKTEPETLNTNLEKKIEERTTDLRQAQEKLIRNEKLAALGKAAGSLSHELRNPLGVISNAIYYLTSPGIVIDNAKLERYLNIIKSQILDANSIIETALDFAKPKSMVFKKNSLNDCIDGALAKLTVPKYITIKKNYGQNLNATFDIIYMQQAIVDVVKNSIEAIEKDGVIEITTSIDASDVKIIIADNGKGIEQSDIDLIFEPLFSKKARGIGLGLSIVKDIINAHNGTVTAESTPHVGTKIIIRFPLRENA